MSGQASPKLDGLTLIRTESGDGASLQHCQFASLRTQALPTMPRDWTFPHQSRDIARVRQRPLLPRLRVDAFLDLRTVSSFLFHSALRSRIGWLSRVIFFPGQKAARQLVFLLAPPPKPVDWIAESCVTRLRGSADEPIRSLAYFTNWGSTWSRGQECRGIKRRKWGRP